MDSIESRGHRDSRGPFFLRNRITCHH
uniref:Uncharacterized protein n=1 Tax=Arundo donax TaxID=35708 RepID=A0A0A9FHI5_ARUDO